MARRYRNSYRQSTGGHEGNDGTDRGNLGAILIAGLVIGAMVLFSKHTPASVTPKNDGFSVGVDLGTWGYKWGDTDLAYKAPKFGWGDGYSK